MNSLRVLVLNQTYEPLHFCNARRAIVMLLKGRTEKIESDGMVARSPTITIRRGYLTMGKNILFEHLKEMSS